MKTRGVQSSLRTSEVKSGVLLLSGYGVRVAVQRRHLVVCDGLGRERRWGRFSKATAGLKRLVVLGHTGTVSFEALRWLHDVGAAFAQIDADGQIIAASAPVGLDHARLRRAQALAGTNGAGVDIARDLVREKLRGQATALKLLPDSKTLLAIIDRSITDLEHAHDSTSLRAIESVAAAAYWTGWASLRVYFGRRDEPRVPDHWKTFGARTSPLTGSPRSAGNPANAMLNYLYAILEAEARIACLAVGLDPGLGVFHADQEARDSLALDILEPLRPRVDAFVLDLLQSRVFRAADFSETREGTCRVLPPMAHLLAETAPSWASAVAPVAERVAHMLIGPSRDRRARRALALPTPLTQTNRSAGRASGQRRQRRPALGPSVKLPRACRSCGILLRDADSLYCDDCHRDRRKELAAPYTAAGLEALADLRSKGADPAHGKAAALKRGARNAQHVRDAAQWGRTHGGSASPVDFVRDILPHLQAVPLSVISKATGLSRGYASMIRRGLYVPHPRHWGALRTIEAKVR